MKLRSFEKKDTQKTQKTRNRQVIYIRMKLWLNNSFMPRWFDETVDKFRAWMSDPTSHKTLDVITYPWPSSKLVFFLFQRSYRHNSYEKDIHGRMLLGPVCTSDQGSVVVFHPVAWVCTMTTDMKLTKLISPLCSPTALLTLSMIC